MNDSSGAIIARSGMIRCVCKSSTEAEMYALRESILEFKWLISLFDEMKIKYNVNKRIKILMDNQSVITILNKQEISDRTKHFATVINQIREELLRKMRMEWKFLAGLILNGLLVKQVTVIVLQKRAVFNRLFKIKMLFIMAKIYN
jgi:cytidylate kinase